MRAIRTVYRATIDDYVDRVVATDGDGHLLSIGYPRELSGIDAHAKAAVALCDKMGWKGTLYGGRLSDCYVFVLAPESPCNHGACRVGAGFALGGERC